MNVELPFSFGHATFCCRTTLTAGKDRIGINNEALIAGYRGNSHGTPDLIVNRHGVGSVEQQMMDDAVARKARLVLERVGSAVKYSGMLPQIRRTI
jgi:hypothetical protein